jgi:hypothetical protein
MRQTKSVTKNLKVYREGKLAKLPACSRAISSLLIFPQALQSVDHKKVLGETR